jgi:hypothetical protein
MQVTLISLLPQRTEYTKLGYRLHLTALLPKGQNIFHLGVS